MPLVFHHPLLLAFSLLLSLVAIVYLRNLHPLVLPKNSKIVLALALFLLSLAAGSPDFLHRTVRVATVLVDLSDSTRVAEFRDRTRLDNRIAQLLGKRPFNILEFTSTASGQTRLPALDPDSPVLLFSDGRFPLPDAPLPPIHPVIDPQLINPYDARVVNLSRSQTLDVGVSIHTPNPANLQTTSLPTTRAAQGNYTIHLPLPDASRIVARLDSTDPWPENNTLELLNLPPIRTQRWWIGANPPENYHNHQYLPSDNASYLLPSVIVLNNIPDGALEPHQQGLLTQYVRDLGGSLLIFGADSAFAAGGYPGTPLEAISPLSSVSPTPARHWVVLVDASGSMADGPRFPKAVESVQNILQHLPQNDPVTLACFSSGLVYISKSEIPSKVSLDKLKTHSPLGPTNLETSLNQLIADLPKAAEPSELLLVSDLDAPIAQPSTLLKNLQDKNIHLHLLALSQGQGLDALSGIVRQTLGRVIQETHPDKWPSAARQLQLGAATPPFITTPTPIELTNPLPGFTPETPDKLQKLWIKPNALPLAATRANPADVHIAKWQFGLGAVVAASYNTQNALALADAIASKPAHPQYQIAWQNNAVVIDCAEDGAPINQLAFQLKIAGEILPIPQIAPGLYRATLPRNTSSRFASVLLNNTIVDQTLLPGKYAVEFDALGNDDYALNQLAEKTKGKVIGLAIQKPLDFNDPLSPQPLATPLVILALFSLAASLVFWRRV